MIKDIKNLGSLTLQELEDKIFFYKKALFDLRLNSAASDKKDTSLFKKYKKSIAKIKTTINKKNT